MEKELQIKNLQHLRTLFDQSLGWAENLQDSIDRRRNQVWALDILFGFVLFLSIAIVILYIVDTLSFTFFWMALSACVFVLGSLFLTVKIVRKLIERDHYPVLKVVNFLRETLCSFIKEPGYRHFVDQRLSRFEIGESQPSMGACCKDRSIFSYKNQSLPDFDAFGKEQSIQNDIILERRDVSTPGSQLQMTELIISDSTREALTANIKKEDFK